MHSDAVCSNRMGSHVVLIAILTMVPVLSTADTKFNPTGCEYTITFPGAPEIKNLYAQSVGEVESASYYGKDYFVKGECAPMQGPIKRDLARKLMDQYVIQNGLQYAVYEFSEDSLGYTIKVRGNKTIDTTPGTFVIVTHFGDRSFITLYAGAPSVNYPTGGGVKFSV